MYKNRLLFHLALMIVFVVCCNLDAAEKKESSGIVKEPELNVGWVDESVRSLTKKMKDEVKKKYKFTVTDLLSFGIRFVRFAKHSKIEKETHIHNYWYSNIGKICTAMGNIKYRYHAAKVNKDADLINKCVAQYRALRVKCLKLLEAPPQIKTQSHGRSRRR